MGEKGIQHRVAHLTHGLRGKTLVATAVWIASACASFGVLHALGEVGISVGKLTRDTTSVADVAPWTGGLSTLGLLAWAAAAGACFTAGMTLRARGTQMEQASYFLALSALAVVLLIDDGYLVHEYVAPTLFGAPEKVTLGIYVVLALAVAYRFRGVILAGRPLLLALATACFAASFLIDGYGLRHQDFTIEDYLKFVGLGTFVVYSLREAQRALTLSN
jgi:hypothetical protein